MASARVKFIPGKVCCLPFKGGWKEPGEVACGASAAVETILPRYRLRAGAVRGRVLRGPKSLSVGARPWGVETALCPVLVALKPRFARVRKASPQCRPRVGAASPRLDRETADGPLRFCGPSAGMRVGRCFAAGSKRLRASNGVESGRKLCRAGCWCSINEEVREFASVDAVVIVGK